MPFVPTPDRAHDDPMTYGEHCRHMKKVHGDLDRATKERERLAPFEQSATDLQAQLSSMPDTGKMTKRLEKAEKERDEAQTTLATKTSEYTTEKALLTAGVTTEADMALVRWKFEQSAAEDFGKYLEGDARKDAHLASLFASGQTPPPAETPGGKTPPPATNNGTIPTPPITPKMTLAEWHKQPGAWKALPESRAIQNELNGMSHLNRKT